MATMKARKAMKAMKAMQTAMKAETVEMCGTCNDMISDGPSDGMDLLAFRCARGREYDGNVGDRDGFLQAQH